MIPTPAEPVAGLKGVKSRSFVKVTEPSVMLFGAQIHQAIRKTQARRSWQDASIHDGQRAAWDPPTPRPAA